MRQFKTSLLTALAVSVVLGGLTGCGHKGNREKWVDNANNRWQDLRSAHMMPIARQALESGDLDRADAVLIEAASIDPDNPRLFVMAGRVQFERGKLERAYHLFDQAIEFDPEYAEAYYYQGIVLERWSRFSQAADAYRKAYEIAPDDVSYFLAWTEAMVASGDRQQAKRLLNSKMTYFDQSAAIRVAAGHLHALDNEHDKAIDCFREASMLAPDDDALGEELALAYFASGRTKEAVGALEPLLKRAEMQNRTDLREVLARAYHRLGRYDDAKDTYLQLTRQEPAEASHWVRLGEMAWEADRPKDTLSAARRAVRVDPHDHRGYMLAGLALKAQSRWDEAVEYFDRAAELSPNAAAPLILRGISLQEAGKPAAAAAAYREALRRQPEDQRAMRLLQSLAPTP
ncbi:MAG: tetratricopeptide repeat protein [Planctomycetota bacterium]